MAPAPVEFHPGAVREARAARRWYARHSPLAARAFMQELDHAVGSIAESPSRWSQRGEGIRCYVMQRFPFLVVYREFGEKVQVIAVAHGRRRPGYWKVRS